MGYWMTLEESTAKFPAANIERIVSAVHALPDPDRKRPTNVIDLFAEWRWMVQQIGDHYQVSGFTGEKYSNDERLWQAIAPYMDDGYLEMQGSDGDRWRWVFKQGTFSEHHARIVWDYEEGWT